jgi:hypothetical protein
VAIAVAVPWLLPVRPQMERRGKKDSWSFNTVAVLSGNLLV